MHIGAKKWEAENLHGASNWGEDGDRLNEKDSGW